MKAVLGIVPRLSGTMTVFGKPLAEMRGRIPMCRSARASTGISPPAPSTRC
jgi:hypothetical protein